MRFSLAFAFFAFSLPGLAQGLKTYSNNLFVFDYPDNYTIQDISKEKGASSFLAVDKGCFYYSGVSFQQGFQNRISDRPTSDCEGVDADLMKTFTELRDKVSNENTTVVASMIGPGLRGGRAMTVRVTQTVNGQTASLIYYFNAVLTTNGLYYIAYAIPGNMPVQEATDMFVMTTEMKDPPLPPNASCSAYVPARESLIRPDADGWVYEIGPDFAMKRPQEWTLFNKGTNTDGGSDIIVQPKEGLKTKYSISIFYLKGVENKNDLYSQCKTMDDVLTQYYDVIYKQFNTSRNQYPYTSVTHDSFMPGRIG